MEIASDTEMRTITPHEEDRPPVMRGTQSIDVLVVGAGPYGLSIAAHLLDAGLEVGVFGEPMAGWRHHMPKGMYLKSTFDASSLSAPRPGSSLADYCAETATPVPDEWHPVPIDMFIGYGDWFRERHVKDLRRLAVRNVARQANGFRVSLADGETIVARTVILSTGHVGFADRPNLPGATEGMSQSGAAVSHACDHADVSRFAGRAVAVIGAGQSALESAVLLREAGADVHLLVRRPSILWGKPPGAYGVRVGPMLKPQSSLGPGWSLFFLSRAPELVTYLPAAARLFLVRNVLGPSGAWWLRSRFEQKISVSLGTSVEGACLSNGKVSLNLRAMSGATSTLVVDHVIAATGYRVDLDSLQFLDPALRRSLLRIEGTSAPRLSRSFESSVPGLYFAGLSAAPTFGPLMRFVCGAGFAAPTIRRALAPSKPAEHLSHA